ncbi:MAG: helix-turn-helix transcriptional regulator [Tepidisphaeraceae bacterium]
MDQSIRLKLRDVRDVFRLVGEIREVGSDPQRWRPHMVRRLCEMIRAEMVVSSEVHFRRTPRATVMRVYDIGWGCDKDGNVWQINNQQEDAHPESYWLAMSGQNAGAPEDDELVAVKPARPAYGGSSFILSQYALPHLGAVDQLGLHRAWGEQTFTAQQHRLVRLFHTELGRLWKKDALDTASDPAADFPPRLAQTLAELLNGASEKQIAHKLELSRHTIHNYVKALHQRFAVSSRGELLAKAQKSAADFTPKLSLHLPRDRRADRPRGSSSPSA